jgi:hypothetical protein
VAELTQCCRLRKTPTTTLKLEFKKAFEFVNWSSFDAILEAKGFGDVFQSWIRDILHNARLFSCPFYAGVPQDVHHLFLACLRLLSIWGCASMIPSSTASVATLSLEGMVVAFSDAHRDGPPLLRMTVADVAATPIVVGC